MRCNRAVAILAALAMLLTGCIPTTLDDQQFDLTTQQEPAQSNAEVQPEATTLTELGLAYQTTDSLNPYKIKQALNRELVPLLYDSLTRPDHTRKAENMIASQITVDGLTYTVKCRADALFSDGSRVTGMDVMYSAGFARTTSGSWTPLFQNVAEISLNNDGDAQFRLVSEDVDFPALLSFPIIKEGTGDEEYPIGVSKYFVAGTFDGGLYLDANPIYYQKAGNIKRIKLIGVTDSGSLQFGIKTGDVDFAYSDLSVPEITSLLSASSAVSLNHMVFLGVNARRDPLSMPEFRHAISLVLNRDQLVSTAYTGRARASMYPFHPDFHRVTELETTAPSDITRAEALLDGLGLEKNDEGHRMYRNRPLELSLLVNSENTSRNTAATLIAEQLAQVGIQVKVVSKSFSQYQADLAGSNYDLYLGETRLMDNMDFSGLLAGGAIAYAAAYSEQLAERYKLYRSTGESVRELCEMFTAQSPFIPLLFREGLISLNQSLAGMPSATEQDLFYNILDW